MGSPFRGNTLDIARRIEAKLEELGDVEFEYVHLRSVDLKPCRGCFTCFMKGEEFCPIKDDKNEISRKLDEADGVIFVSPVYSMHVTYLFKMFVDRFAYNFHRPKYFGKYALLVSSTGNIGLDDTLKYLGAVAGSWGFEVVGELGYIAPPKNTDLPVLADREDRTDEVVLKFHSAIKENRPRQLGFMDHVHFRSMQVAYSRAKEDSPTDYRFFRERGWFDRGRRYFDDYAKTNFFYDLAARAMAWMMGRQMDKAIAKSGQR